MYKLYSKYEKHNLRLSKTRRIMCRAIHWRRGPLRIKKSDLTWSTNLTQYNSHHPRPDTSAVEGTMQLHGNKPFTFERSIMTHALKLRRATQYTDEWVIVVL